MVNKDIKRYTDKYMLIAITITLIVGFIYGFFIYKIAISEEKIANSYTSGYQNASSNITLLTQATNQINLMYLNEYKAIPIYYYDSFEQKWKVLKCEVTNG